MTLSPGTLASASGRHPWWALLGWVLVVAAAFGSALTLVADALDGEDGPTHQPVEHFESLRIFPGINVLRPADSEEAALAWEMAIARPDGPVVLGLTRQNLPVFQRSEGWRDDARRGAYVVRSGGDNPSSVVVATGSEVSLAIEAADLVGGTVRIVSMLCRERFLGEDASFRNRIIPSGVPVITAEAGVSSGWESIATSREGMLALDRFGESGKAEEVAGHLGISAARLADMIKLSVS